MILNIFNKRDTTLYERYSTINTGLDAILEVSKYIADTGEAYNSRALLDFDFTDLQSLIPNQTIQSASFFLKLTTVAAEEIPLDYTLYAYPVSQSWGMGTGRLGLTPATSNGATWTHRFGTQDDTTKWATSSFAVGSTGNWSYVNGGGTWYTNSTYASSQSFSYQTTNVSMDVTNTVRAWISGSLENSGFIVKRSQADESSVFDLGVLKFFSKDTHTVFQPRIEVRWLDATNTGTNQTASFEDEIVVGLTNLQPEYQQKSKVRFNVSIRPKYPTITFATSSNFLDVYQLPPSSSYAILDARTDDVIVPHDYNFTKISSDSKGSFFKLYLNGLQPERYYRIAIKTKPTDTEEYVFDKDWIFKVTR